MSNTTKTNRFDNWGNVETAINCFTREAIEQLLSTASKLRALQADAPSEPATAVTLECALGIAADTSTPVIERWQRLQRIFEHHSRECDQRFGACRATDGD